MFSRHNPLTEDGGRWTPLLVIGILGIAAVVRNLVLEPPPGLADFTVYFACLALLLLRDWIFPAADISVEPSRPQVSSPGGWPAVPTHGRTSSW